MTVLILDISGFLDRELDPEGTLTICLTILPAWCAIDRQTLIAGLDLAPVDETEDLGEKDEEAEVVGVHGTDLVC